MLLEPRPGLPCGRAGIRAIPPPLPEGWPGARQVLADLITRLVFFPSPQDERNLARLARLIPGSTRPRRRGPVRRGDALEPGSPVRPVHALHLPLPVLPARRRHHMSLAIAFLRHAASPAPTPTGCSPSGSPSPLPRICGPNPGGRTRACPPLDQGGSRRHVTAVGPRRQSQRQRFEGSRGGSWYESQS